MTCGDEFDPEGTDSMCLRCPALLEPVGVPCPYWLEKLACPTPDMAEEWG